MKNHKSLHIALILGLLFLGLNLRSQDWSWSKQLSTSGRARVNAIAYSEFDQSTCSITAFDQVLSLGAKTYTSLGDNDILVLKINADGDTLWSSQIGSSGVESPKDVIVDNSGNIFVTGSFSDIVVVDGQSISATSREDAFIAKYLPNGDIDWIKNIAWGAGDERGDDLAVDDAGNIYLTGFFDSTIVFEGNSYNWNGYTNTFILKLDNLGNYLDSWHYKSMESSIRLESIDMSNDGGKLISGLFVDTLILPNNDTLLGHGAEDMFVIKVGNTDTIEWVRQIGGSGSDIAYSAKADQYGSIYVAGQIEGTAYIDSTGRSVFDGKPIVSNGGTDIFIAKYNKQGNLLWKRNLGGLGDDLARGIEISDDIIHFSGHAADNVSVGFYNISTTSLTDQDACFGTINSSGDFISIYQIPGSSSRNFIDRALGISYHLDGGEYICGFFRSDTLIVGSEKLVNNDNRHEGFIAKWIPKLSLSAIEINKPSCSSSMDGSITIKSYFGTPPFNYSWSHNPELNGAMASDLSAGTYKVIVTDAELNIDSLEVTLTEILPINIGLIAEELTCYQSKDGEILATINGGALPYDFTWTGMSGYKPKVQNQSELSAGWYKLVVLDDNGCLKQDSIFVAQPQKLEFGNVIVVPEIPSGNNSGSIELDVTGGTSPYFYSWEYEGNPMPGSTYDTLESISEGVYTAYVLDNNACSADTIIVVNSDALRVSMTKTDLNCFDENDGTAIATLTSGKLAGDTYTYTFTDALGNPVTATNDSTILNLAPGWYKVIVNEQIGGRSVSDSIQILSPDDIVLMFESDNASCNGYADGNITLSVDGGTPEYSYTWSNGANIESLANITAGWYKVIVVDDNLCEKVDSVELMQLNGINLSISILNNIKCNGNVDGILKANVSGGLQPYSFLWNDPAPQTASIATALSAGEYIVRVADSNQCVVYDTLNLPEPLPLSIGSIDTNNVSCFYASDGRIEITMQGGTTPYSYKWNFSSLDTNVIYDKVAFDVPYTVTVTDANGCINDSFSYEIKKPKAELVVENNKSLHVDNLCYGESLGQLGVSATGGWGEYEYSINKVNWQAEPVFRNLASSAYTIYVRDKEDCKQDIDTTILQPSEIILSTQILDNTINVVASGGTSPISFSLNGGTYQPIGQFTNLLPDSYTISVTDDNLCGPIESSQLEIITGINESEYNNLKIFPNPSNGLFNLMMDSYSGEVLIEIYSINGARVYNQTHELTNDLENAIQINLGKQKPGVYLLKIEGYLADQKLIIE